MDIALDYTPQPRQELLHATPARQILYGGAVGGGKSHGLRWDAYDFCLWNEGCQAYLFRRSYTELRDNHIMHVRYEIPEALGVYAETRNNLEFVNGSILHFRYCEKEADVFRYQGTEMHWCGIDEAGQFTDSQINYLKSRNRLGGWKPARDTARLPRFALASNPGGPGHNFLKEIFVNSAPPETLFWDRTMKNPENPDDKGWLSIYIPARIADNKYIDANYAGALGGLPPEMAKAYREGDWDAVVGKAIWNLDRNIHQLRPFTPPKHWTRFQAIDWGTAAPFSVGWYAVSEGAELKGKDNWPSVWLAAGAVVRYAEWYGWNGRPNHGIRMAPQDVARKIREIEKERGEIMDYRIGDTEMWASKGGPSASEWFRRENVMLRQAKKDRKRNFLEIIARLAGNPDIREGAKPKSDPMLFATVNCIHFWRTVPTLTLDDVDPEKGPDDGLENHVYDELAYACRSRPFITTQEQRYMAEWGEEAEKARGKVADPYATV